MDNYDLMALIDNYGLSINDFILLLNNFMATDEIADFIQYATKELEA